MSENHVHVVLLVSITLLTVSAASPATASGGETDADTSAWTKHVVTDFTEYLPYRADAAAAPGTVSALAHGNGDDARFAADALADPLEPVPWEPDREPSSLSTVRTDDGVTHGLYVEDVDRVSTFGVNPIKHVTSDDWAVETVAVANIGVQAASIDEAVAHGEEVFALLSAGAQGDQLLYFDGDAWDQRPLGETFSGSDLAVDDAGDVHLCMDVGGPGLVHVTGHPDDVVWRTTPVGFEGAIGCKIVVQDPAEPRIVALQTDDEREEPEGPYPIFKHAERGPDGWELETLPIHLDSTSENGFTPPSFDAALDGDGNLYVSYSHSGGEETVSGVASERTGDWAHEGLDLPAYPVPELVESSEGDPPHVFINRLEILVWTWEGSS
jgi:hypothetical protein